jgi:hypothetical protein
MSTSPITTLSTLEKLPNELICNIVERLCHIIKRLPQDEPVEGTVNGNASSEPQAELDKQTVLPRRSNRWMWPSKQFLQCHPNLGVCMTIQAVLTSVLVPGGNYHLFRFRVEHLRS